MVRNLAILTILLLGTTVTAADSEIAGSGRSPNILLIIADDLGYSDIGAFGSEIPTPTIDHLASLGTVFTNFHTSPACAPTRAMLLSGVDNHLAGLGTLAEIMTSRQRGQPGYEGYLNDKVVSVASIMRDSGYRTFYSGKWHLGSGDSQLPIARGFERSFAMLGGGGNHFDNRGYGKKYSQIRYVQDAKDVALSADHYSSRTFATKFMSFFHQSDQQAPFFGVLSFTAPHWPLQAPDQNIKRHEETYQVGWDKIRAQRFARLKEIGIIPEGLAYPRRAETVAAWNELEPLEQRRNVRRMATYAAMIELMDDNIGRVLAQLKDSGALSNTIVIFLSDNGPDARDISGYPFYEEWLKSNFETEEPTGESDSFLFAGPGWAQVSTTPLSGAKSGLREGGIRCPLIVADFRDGEVDKRTTGALTTVLDIVPTILDLLGDAVDLTRYENADIYRPSGRSLMPVLIGGHSAVHPKSASISFEYNGQGAVFAGQWKALKANTRTGKGNWSLFDLEKDPSEINDLAAIYPKRVELMARAFSIYTTEVGVVSAH